MRLRVSRMWRRASSGIVTREGHGVADDERALFRTKDGGFGEVVLREVTCVRLERTGQMHHMAKLTDSDLW